VLITYFTLSDATVITFGNSRSNYRAYKAQLRAARPVKPARPMTNSRRLSPHFMTPRATNRDFKVTIRFPEVDKGGSSEIPSLNDRVLTRIEIPQADREVVTGRQFEVIELVEQTLQRSSRGQLELSQAIEGIERACFAMFENQPGPWHPVRALAMNQVTDDVEGAPGVRSLVCCDPAVGQTAQQCVERRGGA
jgi:hypothetical protein